MRLWLSLLPMLLFGWLCGLGFWFWFVLLLYLFFLFVFGLLFCFFFLNLLLDLLFLLPFLTLHHLLPLFPVLLLLNPPITQSLRFPIKLIQHIIDNILRIQAIKATNFVSLLIDKDHGRVSPDLEMLPAKLWPVLIAVEIVEF